MSKKGNCELKYVKNASSILGKQKLKILHKRTCSVWLNSAVYCVKSRFIWLCPWQFVEYHPQLQFGAHHIAPNLAGIAWPHFYHFCSTFHNVSRIYIRSYTYMWHMIKLCWHWPLIFGFVYPSAFWYSNILIGQLMLLSFRQLFRPTRRPYQHYSDPADIFILFLSPLLYLNFRVPYSVEMTKPTCQNGLSEFPW